MEPFLSILHRDFVGFEPIASCEAALPVFRLKLTVSALEKQPLSPFAIFVLRAISYGKESVLGLAEVLGVEARDIAGVGAQLLQLALIEQGFPNSQGERRITLTRAGHMALREQAAPSIPHNRICYLHFNGLTWTVMPRDEEAWSLEKILEDGYFVLPTVEQGQPILGDLGLKEVRECVKYDERFAQSEIVGLVRLDRKPLLEYLAPVQVFLLQHQKTTEKQMAIYAQRRLLSEESVALRRMYHEKTFCFPEDATMISEGLSPSLSAVLPQPLLTAAQQFRQKEEQTRQTRSLLDMALQSPEQASADAQNQEEYERVRRLVDELQKQLQELETLRISQAEQQAEFLQTEQHRPVLFQALREAKTEVIIISPWMNPRTCNAEFCKLVGKAIARGVRIRIAYGFGRAEHPDHVQWRRSNVAQVKRAFEHAIRREKGDRDLLEMKETTGTHQKILVCDRTFAVTGSFNWLSYMGTRDADVREETSVLLRGSEDVRRLATIALRPFSI